MSGFDDTEDSATPDWDVLSEPEEVGCSGSGSATRSRQTQVRPYSFAHLTLAYLCATALGNLLGASELPLSFGDVSLSLLR